MEFLRNRRIAAHCLNHLTAKELRLGTKAVHFDAENSKEWECPSDWEVFALKDGKRVAEVYLKSNTADIVIESWYSIIRNDHLTDFNPADHGMIIDDRYHPVTEDKFPDCTVRDYAFDDIPGLDLPHHPIPNHTRTAPVRVVASR